MSTQFLQQFLNESKKEIRSKMHHHRPHRKHDDVASIGESKITPKPQSQPRHSGGIFSCWQLLLGRRASCTAEENVGGQRYSDLWHLSVVSSILSFLFRRPGYELEYCPYVPSFCTSFMIWMRFADNDNWRSIFTAGMARGCMRMGREVWMKPRWDLRCCTNCLAKKDKGSMLYLKSKE